jgi:penicillin-binding protein 2
MMQSKRWGTAILAAVLVWAIAAPGDAATRRRSTRDSRRSRPAPMPSMLLPQDPSERDRLVGDACRAGLGRLSGGVVAMDPRTGRVMAVVNPQNTVAQAFTPCSVFKIVVATAGLSEGLITPETTYNCTHGCWMWPGHGIVDLRRALAVSCNTYFEWVGEQLGYPTVQKYAQLLGLGVPTGLNVPTEAPGRVPLFVPPSAVGHLSSHAAGITTSAVQIGVLLSATINGGIVFQPQLAPAQGFVAKERWRLPAKTVYKGLADGFLSAVNEGSATGAFDPNVLVAGKTGSCAHLGWFASYAPADRPEMVLVVFLRGGNGHRASDVAGRIYESLYRAPGAVAPAVTAAGGS